jgi:uncharacterized membrane protein
MSRVPFPVALVYISGIAEIVGGIGVLIPSLRPLAGIALVALFIAVFPANLYMAFSLDRVGFGIAPVWLWLRLPIQLVLNAWVWWATDANRVTAIRSPLSRSSRRGLIVSSPWTSVAPLGRTARGEESQRGVRQLEAAKDGADGLGVGARTSAGPGPGYRPPAPGG